jgi:hypothetical protein
MVVERGCPKSTFINHRLSRGRTHYNPPRPMAGKTTGFARVRTLGRALPGSEEGTAWGSPALKIDGQMYACLATNKAAEPNTLAVRMEFAQRDELLAADPDTYYLKEHYVDYPCVLVRLARIPDDALRDLLRMGYEFVRARKTRRPATRRKRSV